MRRSMLVEFVYILLASALVASVGANVATAGAAGPRATSDPVIAAAGDIGCGASDPNYNGGNGTATACRMKYTSNLLVNGGYSAVLTLGDNMQSDPSPTGFATVFNSTWGRVKSLIHPEAGNHDYGYSAAKGYYGYFGAAAGDPAKGYYSFDIGAWHVIALNSNCAKVGGGCAAGSAQEQWLRADLAAHPGRCTLAFDHHARYSSGYEGDNTFMTALYQDLYNAHADLLLSGHSHDYERFQPQDNAGHLDTANGITQFVVGTGGAFFTGLGARHANSAAGQNSTFGVLALTLHPSSYAWSFRPEAGKTWTDSGNRNCHSTTNHPPSPTVTSVSPRSGPLAGGQTVTVTGTDFTGVSKVEFGGTQATVLTVNSSTRLTVRSPAHAAGLVDVRVTSPSGTSPAGVTDRYTYAPAPTVTSVSPRSGPLSGGQAVTVTGSDFTGVSEVQFGGTQATALTVDSPTRLTVRSPAHAAGLVDVRVTSPSGTSPAGVTDRYTYAPPPALSSVSPRSGPLGGGQAVTVSGADFTGASEVQFGGTQATALTVDSSTRITVRSPAHAAGLVDVRVTSPSGTSPVAVPDQYTYAPAPTVTSVSPRSGRLRGGQTVTVTGTEFTGVTFVRFGPRAAVVLTVAPGRMTVRSPAHARGLVDVRVTTPSGTSPPVRADHYTYVTPPTVISVLPRSGPRRGGQTVTITGTDFIGVTSVRFGPTPATILTIAPRRITVRSPRHAKGPVNVTVTTASGTSRVVIRDRYNYA